MQTLGLTDLPDQLDRTGWPVLRERLGEAFARRTRDEWAAVFDELDACVSPVLDLGEVSAHPHLVSRGTVVDVDGVQQPAPAPRFSRTPGQISRAASSAGSDTRESLQDWGFGADEVSALEAAAVVVQS